MIQEKTDIKKKAGIALVVLIFVAFISLGLPDGLLGVAWPEMRRSFGLPLDALGVLLIASTTGYLISSFFNGYFMAKLGVGGLLAVSCALTATALLGYTLTPFWYLMPFFAILSGLGAGAIDAGLNVYVEANYGEGLMQWMHASFGVGVTLGPIIMTRGLGLTGSWRTGYIVVGAAQLILALIFLLTISLWGDGAKQKSKGISVTKEEDGRAASNPALLETFKHLPSWISILLFFVYTGIEFSFGHWTYTLLTESRGVNPEIAGFLAGGYWGFFTIGRILAGFLAYRVRSMSLFKAGILFGLSGSVILALNLGQWISFLGVALAGMAIAPIFPALVSSTSYRVGEEHTTNTIGMQMAAAGLGGSFLPGLAGVLARNISLETIPWFLVVLFIILLGLDLFARRMD
ncbi:MAG TPA: MFS transporter [Halanaerobiales bacterium]|nr:MFS transporter [Halanaerobiales bacterium]